MTKKAQQEQKTHLLFDLLSSSKYPTLVFWKKSLLHRTKNDYFSKVHPKTENWSFPESPYCGRLYKTSLITYKHTDIGNMLAHWALGDSALSHRDQLVNEVHIRPSHQQQAIPGTAPLLWGEDGSHSQPHTQPLFSSKVIRWLGCDHIVSELKWHCAQNMVL